MMCSNAHAQVPLKREDKLKAAYMLNFTKFISWPEHQDSRKTLIFCLQGSPEFHEFFTALTKDRIVGPQKKTIRSVSIANASVCDLVYLQSDVDVLPAMLQNTVIIKDTENVSIRPSVFTFYEQNNKLRFVINMDEQKRLNIVVSSELLKLAKIK